MIILDLCDSHKSSKSQGDEMNFHTRSTRTFIRFSNLFYYRYFYLLESAYNNRRSYWYAFPSGQPSQGDSSIWCGWLQARPFARCETILHTPVYDLSRYYFLPIYRCTRFECTRINHSCGQSNMLASARMHSCLITRADENNHVNTSVNYNKI